MPSVRIWRPRSLHIRPASLASTALLSGFSGHEHLLLERNTMTSSTPKNAHRWDQLCDVYRRARQQGSEDAFRVGRLAIHLRDAFAEACGCSAEKVYHYRYKHGLIPCEDSHTKASNGFQSVSRSESDWVFGLGIELEAGPTTYPKIVVVFPLNVTLAPTSFDVTTALTLGSDRIRASVQADYEADLAALADRMFAGLLASLEGSVDGKTGTSAIGFATIVADT